MLPRVHKLFYLIVKAKNDPPDPAKKNQQLYMMKLKKYFKLVKSRVEQLYIYIYIWRVV